jgi:hypothetical protein
MAEPLTRAGLHELVDRLPEQDLPTVQAFLEFLAYRRAAPGSAPTPIPCDEARLPAVLRDAPLDDEPVTPEDEATIAEGYAAVARGEFATAEELRRELGQ